MDKNIKLNRIGIIEELVLEFDENDPNLFTKTYKAADSMSKDNFEYHRCDGSISQRFLARSYVPYLKRHTPWRWVVNGSVRLPGQFFCPFCMEELKED